MRAIRRIRGDEDGTILVFVAIALAVLLGMVALSFDLGRMAATQTELQSFADNVALAAAGELDGTEGAIERAEAAAAELVADTQTFGLDDQDGPGDQALGGIADYELTFLSELDPDDLPDADGNFDDSVTTDPAEAAFVQVDVTPHDLPMAFASALSVLTGGDEVEAQVAATAVAGFTAVACDITPLMFCLPSEGVTSGQMIYMVSGGGSEPWGEGNFGYLDIRDIETDDSGPCGGLNGTNRTRCALGATEHITACYSIRGVDTKTGASVGIMTDPLNFRFDMFPPSTNPERGSAEFAPAPNTIRGFVPDVKVTGPARNPRTTVDWCTAGSGTPTSMAMPRDDSLSDAARFGTDTTFSGPERDAYVAMNYAGVDPHPEATTRWAYYQAESEAHGGAASRSRILADMPPARESGRAQCSAHQSDDYERRVVIAAGINCDPATGGTEIRGDTNDVPVEEFYRMFLTEPVGTTGGSGMHIYAEVIDMVGGPGSTSSGIFHDVVQLYR